MSSAEKPAVGRDSSFNNYEGKSPLDKDYEKKIETSETLVGSDGPLVKTRGVTRIENVKESLNRKYVWILAGSIFLTAWMFALDSSTTYNYQPYATSDFNRHSMLSTLQIATSIMTSICKPFFSKVADFTSRPYTYLISLILYVLGFIIVACSPTIAAYVIGSVFIALGSSGLALMNDILVADLTPLKWRGLMSSMLSVPYLVTTWVSGYIVENIVGSNWRWGYGMFTIITPVALAPAIAVMFWLDHRANKTGQNLFMNDPFYKKKLEVQKATEKSWKVWYSLIKEAMIEIDAFGLILVGFAFSLLLLPFSLYGYADNGWNNPSMIAMMVVGGVLLIAYIIYEIWFSPFPSLPKRTLTNRTFISCVIIDVMYMLGGYFRILYFSSYTMVVLNLSTQDWVYFSNTLTMGLCFFGVVAGVVFRIFHRYKAFQVAGCCIKIIGMGLAVKATKDGASVNILTAAVVLEGFRDAFAVVGTSVAAQAAVPHQDMASTISILSLYSNIGAAIGTAITAAIWSAQLPNALNKYVPDATKAASFFEDVSLIKAEPWGSENRLGAIKAYNEVCYKLFTAACALSSIMIIGSLLQTNFYLGDQQNCVEGEQVEDYKNREDGTPKTWYDKLADFFNRPLN